MVTGASSGIGRQTAVECSRLGATLVLTARNEERLKVTLGMLEGEGHKMILADLTKEADIQNLVMESPSLDGLVSNAGVGQSKPIAFFTQKSLDDVFAANTFAPMLLNRWLLKKKKLNEGAAIVVTSSVATVRSDLGNGMYGASKAALTAYVHYCARELAVKRIRINAVHPGMVETKLIHDGAISEAERERILRIIPWGATASRRKLRRLLFTSFPMPLRGQPEPVFLSMVA